MDKALAVGVCLMHVSGVRKNGAKAKVCMPSLVIRVNDIVLLASVVERVDNAIC